MRFAGLVGELITHSLHADEAILVRTFLQRAKTFVLVHFAACFSQADAVVEPECARILLARALRLRPFLTIESSHARRLKLLRLHLCVHDRRTNPTVREKIADMVLRLDCLSWVLRFFRRFWLEEEAVLGAGAGEQPDHLLAI